MICWYCGQVFTIKELNSIAKYEDKAYHAACLKIQKQEEKDGIVDKSGRKIKRR